MDRIDQNQKLVEYNICEKIRTDSNHKRIQ